MLQTLLLKVHSKSTWTFKEHSKALEGHSKGTSSALKTLGTRKALEALAAPHLAGSEIPHSLLINWLENPLVVLLETESD